MLIQQRCSPTLEDEFFNKFLSECEAQNVKFRYSHLLRFNSPDYAHLVELRKLDDNKMYIEIAVHCVVLLRGVIPIEVITELLYRLMVDSDAGFLGLLEKNPDTKRFIDQCKLY